MDQFMTAFGALCVLFCVYAIVKHHFTDSERGAAPQHAPDPWFRKEPLAPLFGVSASGSCYPRESRQRSRRRLQRYGRRKPERFCSSHR